MGGGLEEIGRLFIVLSSFIIAVSNMNLSRHVSLWRVKAVIRTSGADLTACFAPRQLPKEARAQVQHYILNMQNKSPRRKWYTRSNRYRKFFIIQ